jgi:hypothetical protein
MEQQQQQENVDDNEDSTIPRQGMGKFFLCPSYSFFVANKVLGINY